MAFEQYLNNGNVRAFLDLLSFTEGANYNTIFGGGTFSSYASHPNRAISAGRYTSTAAGRYQFLASTWNGLVRQYGFGDFSPQNQDRGAIALIQGAGALNDVVNGNFQAAIAKVRGIWPSLPGGSQQTRNWSQVNGFLAQRSSGQTTVAPQAAQNDESGGPSIGMIVSVAFFIILFRRLRS